jgi:hypothetical protein
MTPNPRKRAADDSRSNPVSSKSPRLSTASARPVSPDHRIRFSHPSQPRSTLQPTPDQAVAYRPVTKPRITSNTQAANPTVPLRWTEPQRAPSSAAPTSGTSTTSLPAPVLPYKPRVRHQPHPESKLCQDFHWVPYPLGLMPHDSWNHLHHRNDVKPASPFRCPVCNQERKATAHMRKVFLVAERLSWDDKIVSIHDKDLNEELNWKVNYELGILNPFVEDPEQVPGGKLSRNNKFFPYQNEHEMKLALKLIFMTEDVTEMTWTLWITSNLNLQKMLMSNETEGSPSIAPKHTSTSDSHSTASCTTPSAKEDRKLDPASFANSAPVVEHSEELFPPKRIRSYKSLQDFYSLLDKIERTSYVGALFLEAYAEKLRDDMCKSCWLKHNINLDLF